MHPCEPPETTPAAARTRPWGVVVPVGGRGSRLGGVDKPALLLQGRSLLEHLLDGLPAGVPAALVGPPRPLSLEVDRQVVWCREEPPGGGPAAALAAGAAALGSAGPDVVVVLPGDAPHAAGAVPALLAALARCRGAGAAVAVDAGGRRQVLVAAHRAQELAERITGLSGGPSAPRGLAGLAASRLLPPSDRLVEVAVAEELLADVDSPGDLERLERLEDPARSRGAREAGSA